MLNRVLVLVLVLLVVPACAVPSSPPLDASSAADVGSGPVACDVATSWVQAHHDACPVNFRCCAPISAECWGRIVNAADCSEEDSTLGACGLWDTGACP